MWFVPELRDDALGAFPIVVVDDEEDEGLLDLPLVPGVLAGLLFAWLTILYCDWVPTSAGSADG